MSHGHGLVRRMARGGPISVFMGPLDERDNDRQGARRLLCLTTHGILTAWPLPIPPSIPKRSPTCAACASRRSSARTCGACSPSTGFAAVSAMAFATAMILAPPATSSSLVTHEAPQELPAGSERN